MEQTLFYSFLLLPIVSSSYQHFFNRAQLEQLPCTKYYNKGELYYDCSNKKLITIPGLPTNIVYLNLQHNKIVDLKSDHLRNMGNLKILDLSFNDLKSINNVSFHGLMMLQQLRLNNNKLEYNVIVFPISCLLPLKSLKLLSVQNNGNGFTYPLKQIAHLTELEVLQMDISIDSKTSRLLGLHKRYCNFLHLNSLFLYFRGIEMQGFYFFKIIPNSYDLPKLRKSFFPCTPNLTHLYLYGCVFTQFDDFALSKLNKLKFVQIDYSDIIVKSLPIARRHIISLISALSYTPTEVLIIQNVLQYDNINYPTTICHLCYLYKNLTEQCVWKLFNKILNRTSIRQLHLSNIFGLNQNCTPTQAVINAPPSLQIVNLTMNNLTWIALNLSSVVSLYLVHNRLGNYLVDLR
ncbi:leucine-rich repeat and immunoglobulin-like domain-containing nogo receptor-interacting protein 1 [Mytilus edulis]|uniref:leucine-rich repeat and immunoglobulin-like domain-containing nogo receptor-interacting protein 1 n=1 Tax=Mytilus edulis TaxID=6550 RepID=UPI0039F11A3C